MPNSTITMPLLARHSSSEIAQRKLRELYGWELTLHFIENKHLDPEIWEKIYQLGNELNQTQRKLLLHNAPSPHQAKHILDPQNVDICLDLLELGVKAMDVQTKVALYESKFFDEEHAARMLITGDVPPGYERIFFAMVLDSWVTDGRSRLYSKLMEAVATKLNILSDEQLLRQLKRDPVNHYQMARIIDYHPNLIPEIIKAGGELLTLALPAMALSQHLTEELAEQVFSRTSRDNRYKTLVNLSQNPNAAIRTRVAAIEWVVEASNLATSRSLEDRKKCKYLAELKHLLTGVNYYGKVFQPPQKPVTHPWSDLLPEELPQVRAAIASYGPADYYPTLAGVAALKTPPAPTTDEQLALLISDLITPRLDEFGDSAWDLFLALIPEWEGSEQELLDATLGALIR